MYKDKSLGTTLITGAAGFIGFHLSCRLLKEGKNIIGFDNFNSYYDPKLKEARHEEIKKIAKGTGSKFIMIKDNLENRDSIDNTFSEYQPSHVINLAAQAGVRYSIENPSAYIQSNLVGFGNILEACKEHKVKHLIYASSSSVYGGNTKVPFKENHGVDHPISMYAATKKANELMAHTYSHLYNLPATGLRFFTVYGPWGRPDMALFLFTKSILENKPIKVFNNGKMVRDFTYIDDIIEGIIRVINKPPKPEENFSFKDPDPSNSWCPHKIFNIGNSTPTNLMDYIEAIENILKIKAKKELLPIQDGDVTITSADTSKLNQWTGFKPNTSIDYGINEFVKWYKKFYNII